MSQNNEEFLTIQEVADRLQISYMTVWRWISLWGWLKYIQVAPGKKILIPASEFDRLKERLKGG